MGGKVKFSAYYVVPLFHFLPVILNNLICINTEELNYYRHIEQKVWFTISCITITGQALENCKEKPLMLGTKDSNSFSNFKRLSACIFSTENLTSVFCFSSQLVKTLYFKSHVWQYYCKLIFTPAWQHKIPLSTTFLLRINKTK